MTPAPSPAAEQILSWDDVVRDCRTLAGKARALGPFRGIVAVARGGLIPAALIARLLDIRLVDSLAVSSYEGRARGPARILKPPQTAALDRGEGWLVVDDIADSGATCGLIRTILPRARFAALYAKPQGLAALDAVAVETTDARWIVFPWEAAAPGRD